VGATLEKIELEALALPAKKRAQLADKLWESLDVTAADAAHPELTVEWAAEVKRRCSEIDAGKVNLIPADEAIRGARARIKQKHG
jgi:putative addiction module component (TIGR02574 family)